MAAVLRKLIELAPVVLLGALALLGVLVLLIFLEATGGHDGWLCEWGYDTGPTSDGCV